MAIKYFEEEGVRAQLKNKRKLSHFIQNDIVKKHLDVKTININYIFCNDDSLLEKNIAFLNHNTLTDIITFDLSESETDLQAELYISINRIEENANIFKVSYQRELHRVIFHGILHLCGFKDKTSKEEQEMRLQEDICLNSYFENAE